MAPRPVLTHAGRNHLVPLILMVEKTISGPLQCFCKICARVCLEGKTGCCTPGERLICRIGDGIGQSSRLVNDRDRPIFEAVKLIQTAWFILAGHDKHVRSRFDTVRQGI